MSIEKGTLRTPPPEKTPVATDLFTYCTREKLETWHIVRNHDSAGFVDRVICKACGSEHKFRRTAPAKATASTGSRTIVKRAGSAPAKPIEDDSVLHETWIKALKKWGEKTIPQYDPAQSFSTGEIFEHPTFGKGVVQGRRENRVDVLFSSGMKTLPSKALLL